MARRDDIGRIEAERWTLLGQGVNGPRHIEECPRIATAGFIHAATTLITRPYTSEERKKIQERLQHFYDSFITKAAQGRDMSKEELHERAQGRIWTGSQALEQGLVDGLGGLEDAIEKAIKLSEHTGKVGRKIYPKDGVFWDLLWSPPKADPDAFMKMTGQSLPAPLVNQLSEAMMLSQMMERDGVVAILPTRIEVR